MHQLKKKKKNSLIYWGPILYYDIRMLNIIFFLLISLYHHCSDVKWDGDPFSFSFSISVYLPKQWHGDKYSINSPSDFEGKASSQYLQRSEEVFL